MINLFSIEILLGLILGIILGFLLKSYFTKKTDISSFENDIKNLNAKIDKYHEDNVTDRGVVKEKFDSVMKSEGELVKVAQELKNTLISGGSKKQGAWGE